MSRSASGLNQYLPLCLRAQRLSAPSARQHKSLQPLLDQTPRGRTRWGRATEPPPQPSGPAAVAHPPFATRATALVSSNDPAAPSQRPPLERLLAPAARSAAGQPSAPSAPSAPSPLPSARHIETSVEPSWPRRTARSTAAVAAGHSPLTSCSELFWLANVLQSAVASALIS